MIQFIIIIFFITFSQGYISHLTVHDYLIILPEAIS